MEKTYISIYLSIYIYIYNIYICCIYIHIERDRKREGKSRIGKSRDLFKKIGTIKVTFHARMGMIKDRNGKDLTDAKD